MDPSDLLKNKSNLEDLAKERIESLNVERKITAEYEKQAKGIEQLIGIYKNSQRGFFDNIAKEIKLKKDVRNLENDINDASEKANTTKDSALRAELKNTIGGMKQRTHLKTGTAL